MHVLGHKLSNQKRLAEASTNHKLPLEALAETSSNFERISQTSIHAAIPFFQQHAFSLLYPFNIAIVETPRHSFITVVSCTYNHSTNKSHKKCLNFRLITTLVPMPAVLSTFRTFLQIPYKMELAI